MTSTETPVPCYGDLLHRDDAPAGTAWGLHGAGDEVGTLNFITQSHVKRACELVRTGETFGLDLPVDAFDPALIAHRGCPDHSIYGNDDFHRDDRIDNFYPQASTQIDGLRHMGHPDYGFYNGADSARLVPGDPLLGVNRLADRGIVGRGVLVDVARYLAAAGTPVDYSYAQPITVDVLDAAADAQGTAFEPGDILLLRFGWVEHYLSEPTPARRPTAGGVIPSLGLAQSHETLAWLWDRRFSVVAADNISVECWPPQPDSPLLTRSEISGAAARSPYTGLMHRVWIPLLGTILGELWDLGPLANACAADGRYEFLLVAKPLNIIGGVGSPANAMAIR